MVRQWKSKPKDKLYCEWEVRWDDDSDRIKARRYIRGVVTNRNNDNDGEKIVAEIGYGPGPVGIVFSILGAHGSGGKLGGELHWPVWASCPGAKSEAP